MNKPENKPMSFVTKYYMSRNEVMAFFGCSKQTAQRKLRKARDLHKKKPKSLVTIKEFAKTEGLDLEMIYKFKQQ